MKTLIAGVGYHNLRDLSLGPMLVPALRAMDWPEGVEVDDWSFGPIAIVQRLEERPNDYKRIILISAVERGRAKGRIYTYRWNGELPSADEIQQRISEAIMGVISLDNLLVITQHFDVLPREVYVVEVEPEDTNWGLELTPRVAALRDEVIAIIKDLALEVVNREQSMLNSFR